MCVCVYSSGLFQVQIFWIFLRSRHARQQGKISDQSARLSTYSMTALTMH